MSETKELGDILMDAQGGLVLLYRKAWQALRQHCEARGDNEMAQAMLYLHKVIIGDGKDIPDERDAKLSAAEQRIKELEALDSNSERVSNYKFLVKMMKAAGIEQVGGGELECTGFTLLAAEWKRLHNELRRDRDSWQDIAQSANENFRASGWLDPGQVARLRDNQIQPGDWCFRKDDLKRIVPAGEWYYWDGAFRYAHNATPEEHYIYRRIAPAEPSCANDNPSPAPPATGERTWEVSVTRHDYSTGERRYGLEIHGGATKAEAWAAEAWLAKHGETVVELAELRPRSELLSKRLGNLERLIAEIRPECDKTDFDTVVAACVEKLKADSRAVAVVAAIEARRMCVGHGANGWSARCEDGIAGWKDANAATLTDAVLALASQLSATKGDA